MRGLILPRSYGHLKDRARLSTEGRKMKQQFFSSDCDDDVDWSDILFIRAFSDEGKINDPHIVSDIADEKRIWCHVKVPTTESDIVYRLPDNEEWPAQKRPISLPSSLHISWFSEMMHSLFVRQSRLSLSRRLFVWNKFRLRVDSHAAAAAIYK